MCYNCSRGDFVNTKRISILLAIVGAVVLVIGVAAIVPVFDVENTGGIGIIGGADSPTLKFMIHTMIRSWGFYAAIIGFAMLVTSAVVAIISSRGKN